MKENKNLKGLRGWLILVGIGIVIAPFRLGYVYGPLFYGIFTDGTFESLTSPASIAYHPLWGPFLIGEAIYNTTLLFISIWLIYLFFSKHYLFPKVYIIVSIITILFIPIDAWIGTLIIIDEPVFDTHTISELVRSILSAAIWIPYMIFSKRVEATFIEKKPEQTYPDQRTEN